VGPDAKAALADVGTATGALFAAINQACLPGPVVLQTARAQVTGVGFGPAAPPAQKAVESRPI